MVDEEELPDSTLERARMLEDVLIAVATGGALIDDRNKNLRYEELRRAFMDDPETKPLLPSFVRDHRNLSAFWPYIKEEASTYGARRRIISNAFNPLMDRLEGLDRAPSDSVVSDVLESFDAEGVFAVWSKALDRRATDPEGAITLARTLLETVLKRILDDLQEDYAAKDDLPKLYRKVAAQLNLAPQQHAEESIKSILGSATNLVNGLGTLRNKLSDSHGHGGPRPVRPALRHASLAVNAAGAVAAFLVETRNAPGRQ